MNRPIRVLVVEDNEDDALLLVRTLRKSGYDPQYERVDNAPDMQQALDAQAWDCVISDYSMPQFSALAALDMIRGSGRDLPCFIVSGTISEDMAVAAMRAGAHDYLMKGNLQRLGPAIDRELQEAEFRAQRRQADAARQESEERFRATFNQAAVGIGHVSPAGEWLIVNQKLCAILDYPEPELRTRTLPSLLHLEDRVTYEAQAQRLLGGEGAPYSLEARMLREQGTVWTELTVSLVRSSEGEPKYFIVVIEDISDRKAAEDALRRSQAELEALNIRLKRAMAETHHRVKNNLQVISALVELQMQEGVDQVPASALARVGQHTRALALLHDLLTSEAKGEAEMDTVSAREAIDKLIPIIQATAGSRQIHHNDVADVALPVKAGASLALLVNELLSNALKHGKGDVDVALTRAEEMVALEVCDDGPGFPPDFNSRQAANTGLELVESIGRWDLGGQIAYETRPEGGARVRVTFPVQKR